MKKIILALLLFIPVFINAECDKELHKTYMTYASDISYDTDYSISQKKFTVTLYNVIDELTVKYNNRTYSNKNNEVVISGISEGTNMNIQIYGADGCSDTVKTLVINQPYYNTFYGSSLCNGYENKITYCTHKFTSSPVTEKLVKTAIKNYEHVLEVPDDEDDDEEELTVFQKISNFALKWGIRIILVLVTSFLTNLYFNDKYIKIKHKL